MKSCQDLWTSVDASRGGPVISVVVSAGDPVPTIASQLDPLLTQRAAPPFEVVVSANGSTDATAHLVNRYRDVHPEVRLVDASTRVGVNAVQNSRIKMATAPHIASGDADAMVAPTWLAATHDGLRHHEIDNRSDGVRPIQPSVGRRHV